jgi:hypothetical protein
MKRTAEQVHDAGGHVKSRPKCSRCRTKARRAAHAEAKRRALAERFGPSAIKRAIRDLSYATPSGIWVI